MRSVEVLGAALAALGQAAPRVWVQAGSLAIFGDRGDQLIDETTAPGHGFTVDVCRQWEAAFAAQQVPHTRKVFLRIGFVLGRDGGPLPVLAGFSRRGLGRIGTGRQMVSWLHLEDLERMILWAIEGQGAAGTYNATAPQPVSNALFMASLRAAQRRRVGLPLPAWAVRLGGLIMRTEADLILQGRRAMPARLITEGFQFRFPALPDALDDLIGNSAGLTHMSSQKPTLTDSRT